jgi:hypothetical protein
MHTNILSEEQKQLLPLIKLFRREFYLVGGTAIALQIGHRESIDFDLFKQSKFVSKKILDKINSTDLQYRITRRVAEQINMSILDVKITFFQYPYAIEHFTDFSGIISMPDLLTLAAMKAFALGKRAKWKDYVDLYFILRDFHSINDIEHKANTIFGDEFSGKLFRSQLAYHKDINYSEPVIFKPGFEVDADTVRNFLIDVSLQEL